MANNNYGRPLTPEHSIDEHSTYDNPFEETRPRLQFQEPQAPHREPRPFESSTSLPQDFGANPTYPEHYDEETLPLTGNQGFVGGLYPPRCVILRFCKKNLHTDRDPIYNF